MNSNSLTPDDQPRTDWPEIARIIDANANRAMEGLRVLEDFCRFARDDRFLSEKLKILRHLLATTLARLPGDNPVLARDTKGDVGTSIEADDEYRRQDPDAVVMANMQRVQQSLRCLEEYSKLLDSQTAQQFEEVRYQAYDVHQLLLRAERSDTLLADARLYVIVDGCDSDQQLADRTRALAAAGVDILQLRDKQLDDRDLLRRALVMRNTLNEIAASGSHTPLLIVNDRPDIARAAAADGVHVGQQELPVAAARQVVGPASLVGVSTHSLQQAQQAVEDGADYLGCGPTYPGQTKQFDAYPGPAFLKQVQASVQLPCFAIGGISLQNLADVLATGFTRIVVAGAITNSASPADMASQFRQQLQAASTPQQASP